MLTLAITLTLTASITAAIVGALNGLYLIAIGEKSVSAPSFDHAMLGGLTTTLIGTAIGLNQGDAMKADFALFICALVMGGATIGLLGAYFGKKYAAKEPVAE